MRYEYQDGQKSKVKVEGMPEIRAKLKQLRGPGMEKILGAAQRKVLKPLKEEIEKTAPVDTKQRGVMQSIHMKDYVKISKMTKESKAIGEEWTALGISTKKKKPATPPVQITGVAPANPAPAKPAGKGKKLGVVWYWQLVEYGTQKMNAQPFIRNAVNSTIATVQELFVKEVDKGVTKLLKKQEKSKGKSSWLPF